MKSPIVISALSLFAAGGFAGWLVAPSSEGGPDSAASEKSAVTKSSRSTTRSSRSGGRVHEDARMSAIRSMDNENDRMHAAIQLARTLPLDQAGKWLDEGLFSQRKGYALTLFTKILVKRWQTEEPDGYLVWQLGNGERVSEEEMVRLSESNPDLLLTSIRLIQDPRAQSNAIASLAKANPELALSELSKVNQAALVSSGNLHNIFREMAQTDLGILQSAVESLNAEMKAAAQRAIYGQLLADDFSGTLRQLVDLPNGLEILTSRSDVFRENRQSLLEGFSGLPQSWQKTLSGSMSYLTSGMKYGDIMSTDWEGYGVSGKAVGRLKGYALFSETRNDKEKALQLFQSADLNEAGRRYFLDVLNWNGGEEVLEVLLPKLTSEDRDYVTKKMEEKPRSTIPQQQELTTAADLSAVIAKGESRNYSSLASSMRHWNADQKAQFQKDYAAMQGEERHRVTAVLVESKDLDQRLAAINELLGSPEAQKIAGWEEQNGVKRVSRLAVDLLQQDADRATAWVTGLPEGESRIWAMKNLAANWKNYDPGEAEKWVNTLPAAQQQEVRSFMEKPGN